MIAAVSGRRRSRRALRWRRAGRGRVDRFVPRADAGRGEPHDHSPAAWRLRHLKRSVLRETSTGLERIPIVVRARDPEPTRAASTSATGPSDWRARRRRFATDNGVRGRVQFLTSGAFDQPFEDVPLTGDMAAGVAYVNLAAPVSTRTSWVVEAATAQGTVSSWFVGGSYATVVAESHALDVHSSYSRQRYAGGNPQAHGRVRRWQPQRRRRAGLRSLDAVAARARHRRRARYEYFDYLSDAALFSPSVSVAVSPADHTWVRASVTRQMTAPGAEEFVPQAYGSLALPPQRTFAPLVNGGRSVRSGRDTSSWRSNRMSARSRSRSLTSGRTCDDQLVTVFGVVPTDAAAARPRALLGRQCRRASRRRGWGVSVGRPVASSRSRERRVPRSPTPSGRAWSSPEALGGLLRRPFEAHDGAPPRRADAPRCGGAANVDARAGDLQLNTGYAARPARRTVRSGPRGALRRPALPGPAVPRDGQGTLGARLRGAQPVSRPAGIRVDRSTTSCSSSGRPSVSSGGVTVQF